MLPARFWDKVKTSTTHFYEGTACWEWTASIQCHGYGKFWLNGRSELTHRVSYENIHDKIPKGLVINHLCRNRKCCNPDHLEVISQGENIRKGLSGFLSGLQQRLKTHCKQGHKYTKKNTYIYSNGSRACKICTIIRNRQFRVNKKQTTKNTLKSC